MRRLACALILPVLFAGFACGSGNDSSTEERGEGTRTAAQQSGTLTVVESGFSSYRNSSGAYVTPWAALIQNASKNRAAMDTVVTALFYGDGDAAIATASERIDLLFAGQVFAVSNDFVETTAAPTRMEIKLAETVFTDFNETSWFTFSDVSLSPGSISTTVSGKMANPFDRDVEGVKVICIASSANGDYLGVGYSYVDPPAGATIDTPCRIDGRLDVKNAAKVRLFAYAHWSTPTGR